MWFMDISVAQQGTDVEAVEKLLLEVFGRYERVVCQTIEKSLQSRVASSQLTLRYRVHVQTAFDTRGTIEQLILRLKVRTRSAIHVTHPQSFAIFEVDRPRAVD